MAIELPIIGDQSVRKQFEELIERTSFGATSGEKAGNFDGEWLQFTSSTTSKSYGIDKRRNDRGSRY